MPPGGQSASRLEVWGHSERERKREIQPSLQAMEKSAVPLISTRGCGGFLWAEFRFSLSSPSFIALTFLPSPANLRKTPLGAQATSGWQVSALWEGEACGGRCHAAHWSCIQCGVSSLLASSQSPSSLALPWVFELSKGGKRIVFWCGCLTFELSWGPVRSLLTFHSPFSSSLGMLSVCGVLSWAAGSLPPGHSGLWTHCSGRLPTQHCCPLVDCLPVDSQECRGSSLHSFLLRVLRTLAPDEDLWTGHGYDGAVRRCHRTLWGLSRSRGRKESPVRQLWSAHSALRSRLPLIHGLPAALPCPAGLFYTWSFGFVCFCF